MAVRLDRLPPGARVSADQPAPAARRRASRTQAKVTGRERWRCGTSGCGYETSVWTHAERHADEERHARIECVLTP